MKDIIREMLMLAAEEKHFELASLVNDLLYQLEITANAPSNWRDICEELAKEFKDDVWLMGAVYNFQDYIDEEEF